jgi:hypothetical protein
LRKGRKRSGPSEIIRTALTESIVVVLRKPNHETDEIVFDEASSSSTDREQGLRVQGRENTKQKNGNGFDSHIALRGTRNRRSRFQERRQMKPTSPMEKFYTCPGCAIGFTREEAEDGREVCRNCGKCASCCTCRIEQGDF